MFQRVLINKSFLSCFVFFNFENLKTLPESPENNTPDIMYSQTSKCQSFRFFPLSKGTVGVPCSLPGPILLAIPGVTSNMHLMHLLESGLLLSLKPLHETGEGERGLVMI